MSTTLRKIREEDLEMIMNWRMDPDVTKYLNTNPTLTLEGQKKWLSAIKSDKFSKHWLIEKDCIPVGIIQLININWEEKTASWGYYIGEKKARSLDLAISLEMSLYDYVFDVLELQELNNEVFSLNSGVIKLHIACGNKVVKEVIGEIEKDGVLYDITHLSICKDKWNSIREGKKYQKINFDIEFKPHHVGIAVKDIDTSISQYRKLGYIKTSEIFDDTNRNVRIVFMESIIGKQRIELIEPIGNNSPVTDTLKRMKNISSPYHICYEVESVERSVNELKRRGFIITASPSPAIAFNNRVVVFLLKKEIGLIELLEE